MTKTFNLLPTETEARIAEQRYIHILRGKEAVARRFEQYKTLPCRYQLFRGDTPMGHPRELIVADVMVANKRYRDKFWAALDTDPAARLWEWRALGKTAHDKRRAEFRQMVKALPLPPEKTP
jgi:hypothetical protein